MYYYYTIPNSMAMNLFDGVKRKSIEMIRGYSKSNQDIGEISHKNYMHHIDNFIVNVLILISLLYLSKKSSWY